MADPFGGFTEEALAAYQKALAEQEGTDFAEGDSYDFTTCIRPDGSAYGTGGKCRKGTEGEAKSKETKSQVSLVTPQKQGQADVDRLKKYAGEEAQKLKNLNDSLKQNPDRANDADVVSRKKVLERNVASAKQQLDSLKPAAAKKPEQSTADKAMEMVKANARARGLTEIKAGGSKPSPNLPLKEAGDAFRRALRENQPREAVQGYDWRNQSGTFRKADND